MRFPSPSRPFNTHNSAKGLEYVIEPTDAGARNSANCAKRNCGISAKRYPGSGPLTAKLERTRAEVRRAQENVQASEGRFLDFSTAEAIQRALVAAARNLQELTLQVACLERKR